MADTLKAVVYGNNIDTDAIIAARYLNTSDPEELASHCMEDIDSGFAKKAGKECVLVAGENFGCGSSREHAPIALKAAGVKYVIAKSFARIFYRNAINTGLPIIECPKAVGAISTGDKVSIDIKGGTITAGGKKYAIQPFPDFLQEIIESGGLMYAAMKGLGRDDA